MAEVKPGVETTEYKVNQSSNLFSYVAVILALVATYAPQITGLIPEESKAGAIVAAVIGVAAILQRLLVNLGYIKSRTEVKTTEKVEGPEIL